MELDVDIGNTFLKWRCSRQGVVVQRGQQRTRKLNEQPLFAPIRALPIRLVRVGSVAGKHVDEVVAQRVRDLFGIEPFFANTQVAVAGVTNSYTHPERMGVDRWLAMVAAYQYAAGACCVVDCGSAITVDWVDGSGSHVGGYIVPGLELMREALLSRTAQVKCRGPVVAAITPGQSTESAVHNGALYVAASLSRRVLQECGERNAKLYVCGGDGRLFAGLADATDALHEDLVLDGLKWVCKA